MSPEVKRVYCLLIKDYNAKHILMYHIYHPACVLYASSLSLGQKKKCTETACVCLVIKDIYISVLQWCCYWKPCVLQRNHSIFWQHVCRDVSCVKCITVRDRRICRASSCFSLSDHIHISRCPFLSDSFILSHSKKENRFPCWELSSLTYFTLLWALHNVCALTKMNILFLSVLTSYAFFKRATMHFTAMYIG